MENVWDATKLMLIIYGMAAAVSLWTSGRTFNPVIGIAGVSCVPTTAKVAQKEAREANKVAQILPWAMGASICGVISSAILAAIYVTVLR